MVFLNGSSACMSKLKLGEGHPPLEVSDQSVDRKESSMKRASTRCHLEEDLSTAQCACPLRLQLCYGLQLAYTGHQTAAVCMPKPMGYQRELEDVSAAVLGFPSAAHKAKFGQASLDCNWQCQVRSVTAAAALSNGISLQ